MLYQQQPHVIKLSVMGARGRLGQTFLQSNLFRTFLLTFTFIVNGILLFFLVIEDGDNRQHERAFGNPPLHLMVMEML